MEDEYTVYSRSTTQRKRISVDYSPHSIVVRTRSEFSANFILGSVFT